MEIKKKEADLWETIQHVENVSGSGSQEDITPLHVPLQQTLSRRRETVLKETTRLKQKKLETMPKALHEYGGKFGVQQDHMDKISTAGICAGVAPENDQCLKAAMAQQMDDVIHLCCEIADQPEFKNTLKNILKGMSITAAGAAAGAFLFGPPGLALGAAVGGGVAWWWTSGQFKSVPQILMELPPTEKQKLYNDVVAVLGELTWTDTAQLVRIVMSNPALQERVTVVLLDYIKNNV